MADTCARLRPDLEMRPESPDPRASVIVKDPVTRGFFRFTWVQAAVLRGLDGRHSPAAVAEAAAAHCQVEVETGQVQDFIGKLRKLLLLDEGLIWSQLERLAKPKRPLLRSLLSIKIGSVNPDRLLTRLDAGMGRLFFSRGFHVIAWASIAGAAILSIVNWEQLFLSWQQILTLYSIPLILAVAFAVMTTHELAHGLTLKHFGGKVEEAGFLFLYAIPAFYCNVSDAWLLGKRRRMAVSVAGGYIQLVVWAWATIAWRLLAPETLGSRICLIAIAFSGILTLFNFNPLLRLDGYYLLSDYLEIPNLRQRAFGHLKRILSRWAIDPGLSNVSATRRERRILLLYGVSSFAFSAGLVLLVLSRLGSWMIAEYRTWGVLLFFALCLMVVPVTRKENLAATGRVAAGIRSRIKRTPYLLIVVALLLAASLLPWELKVTGDFTILPSSQVAINPQVEGTLKAIYVDEGDLVRKGDVLAEIQNLDLSNGYEETRGELASSRASLRLLEAGSRPEEIERAQRMVATRKTELDNVERVQEQRSWLQDTVAKRDAELQNARATYDRSTTLLNQGLIPKNEFERDKTAFDVKQKELAEARGELKMLEERIGRERQLKTKELEQAQSDLKMVMAGSRAETIQGEAAQVAKLEERLNILGLQLEQLKIRSSIDGLVATPYLKNKIGKFIAKGNPFCEIVDDRLVNVDMPVPENEIGDVSPGFTIVLKVRTYPQRLFIARVKTISPVAVEGGLQRTVIVRGELENSDGALKSGMTGVGKILCGQRMIIELVSRRAIRWLRTEFWEFLP